MVPLALEDLLEAADGVLYRDVAAFAACEDLGDEHRLCEEALDAAGAADGLLVLFRELLGAEDGDDVLEVLVALEDGLDTAGRVVVLLADDERIEDSRERGERVDGRVEALLDERALERDHGVEVAEGRDDAGVGVVVGGDVDRLEAGDRAALGGRDALFEVAHVGGERGLVADGGRHTSEERGDFHVREDVAVDVVDEDEDVLLLLVAEVFGHRDAGEADSCTDARRLVHLAEDERRLLERAGLAHLDPEVVAFAGALADAGKHGEAAVLCGDVADELLNDDGLANTRAAVSADLAALRERRDEVEHLDAGLEDLRRSVALLHQRGGTVDRPVLVGLYVTEAVQRLAEGVEQPAEDGLADGHCDRESGVGCLSATAETVGRVHGERAHPVVPKVLLDFKDQLLAVGHVQFERVVDLRQALRRKLDVDDCADYLDYVAFSAFSHEYLRGARS